MRKSICFFLSLCFLLAFSGCEPPVQPEEKPIIIGFCLDTLVLERWQRDRDIFTAEAQELNAQVQIRNANGNAEIQKTQIRELIEDDVSAIVVIPIDSYGLAELVEAAHRKGIPVIAYDRLIAGANVDAFISFDTENTGRFMVEQLVKAAPEGDYVIIGGSLIDTNMHIITQGIKEEIVKYPEIRLVEESYCDNWSASCAFEKVSGMLRENREIKAVLCGNDSLAIGTIRALSEYQLAGLVAVSGQDADLESCQRIVEGTQNMTLYKPIHELAEKAAEVTVALVKGEQAAGGEDFDDGHYVIRRYAIATIVVTAENMMESVIAGGFHRMEDVYRNVPREQWPAPLIPNN